MNLDTVIKNLRSKITGNCDSVKHVVPIGDKMKNHSLNCLGYNTFVEFSDSTDLEHAILHKYEQIKRVYALEHLLIHVGEVDNSIQVWYYVENSSNL